MYWRHETWSAHVGRRYALVSICTISIYNCFRRIPWLFPKVLNVFLMSIKSTLDLHKFYRTLLGVPRHCSTVGTHTELGRYPIEVDVQRAMVKYWFRLITLPSSRLASHCYWSLFDTKTTKDPWFNSIKATIDSTGQYFVWNDQKSLSTNNKSYLLSRQTYICNTLKDLSIQKSSDKMASETKLSLLMGSKSVNLPAKYLNQIPIRPGNWKR